MNQVQIVFEYLNIWHKSFNPHKVIVKLEIGKIILENIDFDMNNFRNFNVESTSSNSFVSFLKSIKWNEDISDINCLKFFFRTLIKTNEGSWGKSSNKKYDKNADIGSYAILFDNCNE